jgi:hypothetical protein
MLIMRRRVPDAVRKFRTPWAWPVGTVAILGCIYLFVSLPAKTQQYFLIWNAIGLIAYLLYGFRKSPLAVGRHDPMQYAGLVAGAFGLLLVIGAWAAYPGHGPGVDAGDLIRQWMLFLSGLCVVIVGAILFAAGAIGERMAAIVDPSRKAAPSSSSRGGRSTSGNKTP